MTKITPQPGSITPTCFVSYSWDSEEHKSWVRRLATSLRSAGVDARMDQWDAQLGMDLPKYMEERIRSSDYVLLVCTPGFAKRANAGKGGVGYEKVVITGELYAGAQPTKFIPVLRSGSRTDSLPSYLMSKLFLDLRDDSDFEAGVQEIVRHIYQRPGHELPPLGVPGILAATGVPDSARKSTPISFATVMEYACVNYPGLDVTPDHIREIVGNLAQLGYRTIDDLDMAIRPVRHIAREVDCWACRRYACDQITIALALSNPEYFVLLGTHQAEHTEWLRRNKPSLRSDRKGWL
jgi:hypothetical protein